MSARKLLILTGVVLVLFAFIFFFERRMPTTAERQQKGDFYWDLPEDRVESILMTHGGEAVELVKAGESWKLVRPEQYPADSFAANDLASQLADLRNPGGESGAEGKPEGYGLEKPSAKATLVWKDPKNPARKESRTIEFGIDIPGTDLAAARVPGTSRILFVSAKLASTVRKPADDFKSKDVFGGASVDVASIDIARGRGRLVLAKKKGIWWLDQPISDLADRDVADRLSNDLGSLRVTEFVPRSQASDLSALGLAPPAYRITLTDTKGARRTLDLGSTRSDGNSVYAAHEGQVFTIASSITDDLSKEAVAYRDKRLVRFERSDVTGITVSADGGKPRVFGRQQAGWSLDGKAILASVADDLMTAILDVESRAFLDDAPLTALAARPAVRTIEIRSSAGPPWKISLYSFRSDFAAFVTRRPGAFAVSREAVERLGAAIEKAETAPVVTPAPTAKQRAGSGLH